MATMVKVLIVEEQLGDAELLLHELREYGFDPDWSLARTEVDYLVLLEPSLDVILSDYTLPKFSEMDPGFRTGS